MKTQTYIIYRVVSMILEVRMDLTRQNMFNIPLVYVYKTVEAIEPQSANI